MDCGAVQSGPLSCQACGGGYQFNALGFRDLYSAYAGPLRRFVCRLAADWGIPESLADTDGVVHDTFVVLLSGSGQPIRNPAAWLFTVARNLLKKAGAAQRRVAPGDPADHLDDGAAAWATLASPPADAEDVRAAREVMDEISGLPDNQRIATYLHQVQGWSHAEIGAYLNCAASTAGVHISRGTRKVRSSLDVRELRELYMRGSRRRRTRLPAALAAAGILLAAAAVAAARARGLPWSLAVGGAAFAAVPAILAAAVGWWLQEEVGRRLWAGASARHRRRRFNRWLRTGRALDPPGRHSPALIVPGPVLARMPGPRPRDGQDPPRCSADNCHYPLRAARISVDNDAHGGLGAGAELSG